MATMGSKDRAARSAIVNNINILNALQNPANYINVNQWPNIKQVPSIQHVAKLSVATVVILHQCTGHRWWYSCLDQLQR